MQTVKLVIAYDGTDFHGFARQNGLRTVQGVLEETLTRILREPIEVFGSGRTDKGVHARAQVVHFTQPYGPEPSRYPYILQRALPPDIVPIEGISVPETFHARFSAVGKTYRYTLYRGSVPDIFTSRYVWHLPGELAWSAMRDAAGCLLGEHDFTSFCAAATPVENKRRTVHEIRFDRRDDYMDIYVSGSGFLQYMVRIIVGTLVDIGQGRLSANQMPAILAGTDRRLAGQTAPAKGLALWEVHYSGEQRALT